MIRHIDNLESFSDDSDEELMKTVKLMISERAVLKMYFWEEQFRKCTI